MNHLPNNLRIIRQHLDLSQADFAKSLDLSRNSYNGYENKITPPLEVIIAIATKLSLSLNTLILVDWRKYSQFKKRQVLFRTKLMSKIS